MTELVTGVLIGFAVAALLAGVIGFLSSRRSRDRRADELRDLEESVRELRQERAEDKETNRRLRHELVARSPERLVETATTAEMERDAAISERDQALEQLNLVQRDLATASARLTDRESKLRQYREALKEIRMALEAQGGLRPIGGRSVSLVDTAELPATIAQAAAAASAAPEPVAPAPATPGRTTVGGEVIDAHPAPVEGPVEAAIDPEPVDLSAAD